MIDKTVRLDFNDLNILGSDSSNIDSRTECDVTYGDGRLPLFTAPMDTVVSGENYKFFQDNGITPIMPRTANITELPERVWKAVSLKQFDTLLTVEPAIRIYDVMRICIDVANGHMSHLCDSIRKAKALYGDSLVIMAGNVANPIAYLNLSEAGADFVRVGIGNGAGCLTTLNTGVGYPMASLIDEVYKISCTIATPAEIVADGGMQSYDDIIKALALGADYVMIGSIFNKALESAGATFREIVTRDGNREIGEHVAQYSPEVEAAFKGGARFYKHFRGMSTKDVQRELGNSTIRTSEGVSRTRLVEYTLAGWVENFKHYLSTAMSYTGHRQLMTFIGKITLIRISENSAKRVKK